MREAQEIILKRTKRDHRNEPDLDSSDEKKYVNGLRRRPERHLCLSLIILSEKTILHNAG